MKLLLSRPISSPTRSALLIGSLAWVSLGGQARADVILPTAVNDAGMTASTAPVTVNVVANDQAGTYPIDPTSVEIVTAPAQGSASVNPTTGAVTYTPVAGTAGTFNFEYAVRDSQGNPSYPAQISIQVIHNPPTANNDNATVAYNQSVQVNVLLNDTAGTSQIDATSVEIVTQPTRGSVSVNATTGVVTYTPSGTAAGSDSFQYRVSDTEGVDSNTATVNVGVTNNPPQVTHFGSTYQGNHVVRFSGKVIDEDPAHCTVHLGYDLNIDVTPDAQGDFVHVQVMTPAYGQASATATDTAGQQSQLKSCWYFCQW